MYNSALDLAGMGSRVFNAIDNVKVVVADSFLQLSLHVTAVVVWFLAQLGLAPWRPNNSPHSHTR